MGVVGMIFGGGQISIDPEHLQVSVGEPVVVLLALTDSQSDDVGVRLDFHTSPFRTGPRFERTFLGEHAGGSLRLDLGVAEVEGDHKYDVQVSAIGPLGPTSAHEDPYIHVRG